jgi:hypothetical protein
MIEVLAHRLLPADAVIAGMHAALAVGVIGAAVVIIEARKHARRHRAVLPIGTSPGSIDRHPSCRSTTTCWRPNDHDRLRRGSVGAATENSGYPSCAGAARLAESCSARSSYLAFLAEVLSAEVDAVNDASNTRVTKRLRETPRHFDLDAAPTINPATIATRVVLPRCR